MLLVGSFKPYEKYESHICEDNSHVPVTTNQLGNMNREYVGKLFIAL